MGTHRSSALPVAVLRAACLTTGAGLAVAFLAACGGAPAPGATTAGTTAPAASPLAASSPPSTSGPATGAAPGGAGDGQCPVTPEGLAAATTLEWALGRTLPEHPLEFEASISGTTCVFTADAVKDEYGTPLALRTDVATGANATALEKYEVGLCGRAVPAGTLRAARGGSGKVCEQEGSVADGVVVQDGRTISLTLVSASPKVAAKYSAAFEAVVASLG